VAAVFIARRKALARIPLGAAVPSERASAGALLREAVLLASRQTSAGGAPSVNDPGLACTRRGYEIRLRSRTTPHGVFAGAATAKFIDGPGQLSFGEGHRVRTTPSAAWLAAVCARAVEEPGVLERLTLHTSTLLTRHGERFHSELPGGEAEAGPMACTVKATEVTSCIVEAAQGGVPAAEVVALLERRWPQATAQLVKRTLVDLLRSGVLLHDLIPADPRTDALGHLLERLPAGSPRHDDLVRLRSLLTDADRHRPGAEARWPLLVAARDLADRIQPCERPLRADTVLDATLVLPAVLAREAAEAAGMLWRIGWGSPPLREYHQAFRERYGTGRAVPLLEATDPVIGLGCVPDVPGIGPALPDPAREAALACLLAGAAAEGRTEISLDPDTIAQLRAPAGDVPPRTAEIYVRVLANTARGPDAGRIRLALCPGGGSQDAGSTSGRFSALLPGVYDEVTDEVPLVAELVVLPRTFDTASVAPETRFATCRIPLGVPARPGDLLPEDLLLTSTGRCLAVWSASLQRQVVPVVYSRLSPGLLPPLARLLSLIGQGDARPWHGWTWRSNAPFQPAVRYRRVLLAPARWLLLPHLTSAARSSAAWVSALQAWRADTRPVPPRTVVTDDGDRHLPLDLDHPLDRELLRRYAQRGLRAVTAPLPDDTQAVLPGPGGHHLLDLTIALRRAESAPPTPAPRTYAPQAAGTGIHLPGSQWLSVSLRAPAEHHDAILATLSGVATCTAGHWRRWFWLRYHDRTHGPHLRIRFQGEPAVLGNQVLPVLAAWGADLYRQRLSGGFSIDPYEQETERYGGPGAITAAEDVFAADSDLALHALAHAAEDGQRTVIAALSAAAIARSLADPPTGALGRHPLERSARRRAVALRALVRATDRGATCTPLLPEFLRGAWTRRSHALAAYRNVLPAKEAAVCASDLIHLHCNRLVPGEQFRAPCPRPGRRPDRCQSEDRPRHSKRGTMTASTSTDKVSSQRATGAEQALTTATRLLDTRLIREQVPGIRGASLSMGLAGTALLHARLAFIDPVFEEAAGQHWAEASRVGAAHSGGTGGIYSSPGALAASLIIGSGYLNDPGRHWAAATRGTHWLSARAVHLATWQRERISAGGAGTPWHVYDLINGLSGIGRVLLAATVAGHQEAEPGLTAARDTLTEMLLIPDGPRPGWWRPIPQNTHAAADPHNVDGANTGLAHGVAGPMAFLAACESAGYGSTEGRVAIRGAADWLLAWRDGDSWPPQITRANLEEAAPTTSRRGRRYAWCYGAPGIGQALTAAGRVLNDPIPTNAGAGALAALAERSDDQLDAEGPTVCHGHAGKCAAGSHRAQANAAESVIRCFDRRHLFCFQHAQDRDRRDEPGLLTGAAGVALVLADYGNLSAPTVPTRWDAVLLLS
jgi:thiopeptide-type bacteriocin biosynthesis protein